MGCSSSQADSQSHPASLNVTVKRPQLMSAKVVLLGDSGVGKSSIAQRYVNNTFTDAFDITVGGGYLQQIVRLQDGANLKLDIWDTGGQERFRALLQMYYREAQAAVICYDVTSEKSLDSCEYWVNQLKTHEEQCLLYLVGNKSDLRTSERRVSATKVEAFAAANGMAWFETSAKTGENVNRLFDRLATEIATKMQSKAALPA